MNSAAPNLQHTRSAWPVALLALGAWLTTVASLFLLRSDSALELFVLIGMAVSVYAVLQVWLVTQCVRAIRRGPGLIGVYLALLGMLFFFSGYVVIVALPIFPALEAVRVAVNRAALPIIIPTIAVSLLLAIPLARFIARRRLLSDRAHAALQIGFLGAGVAILLPVPLFIYLAQFVEFSTEIYITAQRPGFWHVVVHATPEFVGDIALYFTERSDASNKILATGRVSNANLQANVRYMGPATEALRGLALKDRHAALQVGLDHARNPVRGSFGVIEGLDAVAKLATAMKTVDEYESMIRDRSYNAFFRDRLMYHFRGMEPKRIRSLSEELMREGGFEYCYSTMAAFADTHSDEEYLKLWCDWLQEKGPERAIARARYYETVPKRLRWPVLRECLRVGDNAMISALLNSADGRWPVSIDQRNALFVVLLEQLERTENETRTDTLRFDIARAIVLLGGKKNHVPEENLKYEALVRDLTRKWRAHLESTPELKNSASQPAPAE